MARAARLILALFLAAPVWAQENPAGGNDPAPAGKPPTGEAEKKEENGARVVGTDDGDEVKVLKPKDVPAELGRLKTKADIKAEVTIRPHHGRSATFKGVIRNGKLIERFFKRRFRSETTIDHPRAGVRLWWIGNSSGWMFFRYANIQSIALTGRLTDQERAEIMKRLRAGNGDEEKEKKASADQEFEKNLEKLSEGQLKSYLLRTFPEDDGWDREKHKALKRKQILENKPLDREEALFVKHYSTLMQARLERLKQSKRKVDIEPGTEDDARDESGRGRGLGLPPGAVEPSGDDR